MSNHTNVTNITRSNFRYIKRGMILEKSNPTSDYLDPSIPISWDVVWFQSEMSLVESRFYRVLDFEIWSLFAWRLSVGRVCLLCFCFSFRRQKRKANLTCTLGEVEAWGPVSVAIFSSRFSARVPWRKKWSCWGFARVRSHCLLSSGWRTVELKPYYFCFWTSGLLVAVFSEVSRQTTIGW